MSGFRKLRWNAKQNTKKNFKLKPFMIIVNNYKYKKSNQRYWILWKTFNKFQQ